MKKRTILTTVVAFVLLVAVIAAGLNAVFTVTYVNANFLTYTEEGERAAQELREELNGCLGKSTTFLDLDEVHAAAQTYPRLRVVRVEKEYPASILVEVEERRAAFALAQDGGYGIIDGEGVHIGQEGSSAGCIELVGEFSLTVEDGMLSGGYAQELLALYAAACETLGEPRANLVSVSLEDNSAAGTLSLDRMRISTREGVEIVISEPSVRVREKVLSALSCYCSLGESERVRGRITAVIVTDSGAAKADYTPDAGM